MINGQKEARQGYFKDFYCGTYAAVVMHAIKSFLIQTYPQADVVLDHSMRIKGDFDLRRPVHIFGRFKMAEETVDFEAQCVIESSGLSLGDWTMQECAVTVYSRNTFAGKIKDLFSNVTDQDWIGNVTNNDIDIKKELEKLFS